MTLVNFIKLSCPSKWGSSQSRPIQVSADETFDDLKIKVLTKMNLLNETSYYVIAIFYESYAKGSAWKMKPISIPHGNQCIVEKILLEESNWYSKVKLVMLDYRLRRSWKSMVDFRDTGSSKSIVDSSKPIVLADPIESIVNNSSMMYDVDRTRNNDDVCLPDAMQQSLSNIALRQGTLKRKVVENYTGKEVWKETTVFLCENRIWYRSQRSTDDISEISFIELLTTTTAFVRKDLGSGDFMVVNYDDGNYSSIFRAKNADDATEWVRAIIERKTLQSDNDAILTAETFISSNEETTASRDLSDLLNLNDFEKMIDNNYMRSKYRSFLASDSSDDSFKFWERCEDFHRGHPQSPTKFAPDTNLAYNESETYVIAKDIYSCFLKQGTSAIPLISSSDSFKLRDKIAQESNGLISPSIFKDIQNAVYSSLRNKYYSDFLTSQNYRKVVHSAIHATTRNGADLMSKCVEASVPENNTNAVYRIVRRISAKPENSPKHGSSTKHSELTADIKSADWRAIDGLDAASVPWLPDEWWARLKSIKADKQPSLKPTWLFESYDTAMDTLHLQLKPYYDKKEQEDRILSQNKLEFRPFSLELTNNPHLKRRLSLGTVSSTIQKYTQPCTTSANFTSRGHVIYFGVIHCRYYERYIARLSELSETDNKTEESQSWNYNYGVLIEHLGQGQLLLYDPVTFVLHTTIHLRNVIEISPSTLACSGIDIKDNSGLIWRMIPVGVDSYDSSISFQRWLSYLRLYSSPESKHINILKSGSLSKRGKLNTNYRRRHFVMYSNHFFRYFKDSSIGTVCKGCIDFRSVKSVEHVISEGLGWLSPKKILEKEIVLKTSSRIWAIRADSVEDANDWFELFNTLLEKCQTDNGNVNPNIVSGAFQSRIVDDDDDSD